MARYRVSEVAAMARVSVRALHHYHRIGLLVPAHVGENGYRHYGRAEMLRLQQILLHRALGIPLGAIAAILDAPDFDRLAALKRQRAHVAQEAARSAAMLGTIDRTIATLEGDHVMEDHDLYTGIVAPEKQAEHAAWLEARHGPGVRAEIADGERCWAARGDAGRAAAMAELAEIERALADAMQDGVDAASPALDPPIARHRAWVEASWGRAVPAAAYACLADTYEAHPDFVARYETIAPGFAAWLVAAMRAWAARQG